MKLHEKRNFLFSSSEQTRGPRDVRGSANLITLAQSYSLRSALTAREGEGWVRQIRLTSAEVTAFVLLRSVTFASGKQREAFFINEISKVINDSLLVHHGLRFLKRVFPTNLDEGSLRCNTLQRNVCAHVFPPELSPLNDVEEGSRTIGLVKICTAQFTRVQEAGTCAHMYMHT